ncbi:SAF domain-containing protein [Catenulispora rubra]|uniref:SAF domain-containing protein n=1 Tax=Catenulispora rubra TaxID=280293 RepID=UPI0018925BB0|nr:SAF domain-containing protein [Catenulispora rubra]
MATPLPSTRLPRRLPRPGKSPGAAASTSQAGPGQTRVAASGRKRARPYVVLGAVLAVGGAFAVAGAFSHLGGKVAVLQLARPVHSGQILSVEDVRSVEVAAGANVPLITLSSSGSVIGHPVAMSLPAGTLLSPADLGSSALPSGQAMVAVQVKAGAFPTELASGQKVAVAAVTPAGTASGVQVVVPSLPTATVISTTSASDSSGSMSVTLQTDSSSAGQIASIPAGQVQLIVVGSGTGS